MEVSTIILLTIGILILWIVFGVIRTFQLLSNRPFTEHWFDFLLVAPSMLVITSFIIIFDYITGYKDFDN